jgi:hypothetical protein
VKAFGGWIVKERFLSMQLKNAGGQETALCVGLAAIQIDYDAHLYTSRLLRVLGAVDTRGGNVRFVPGVRHQN